MDLGEAPPEFTYISNGDGRRVSKVAPDGGYGYFYSLLGLALEQKNLVDQAKYVRLPNGSPLSITNATGTYYYFQDASGNVRGLLNATGFAAQYNYYPFGEDLGTAPETPYNPLRFAASVRDQEGGASNKYQYYMMARYYDPTYGRFIKGDFSDPNFPAAGRMFGVMTPLNYAYADNNPVVLIDDSGHNPYYYYAVQLIQLLRARLADLRALQANRMALKELMEAAKRRGGLTMEQFEIVKEWAKEVGWRAIYHLSQRGEWGSKNWHFDVGPIHHIPDIKK